MPTGAPEIGEVWELQLLGSDVRESAAITQLSVDRVELISRLGRIVVVPTRSFELSWRYLHSPPSLGCIHEDCPSPGYIQSQALGRWVWTCKDHIPPGTNTLFLAGDSTAHPKVQCQLQVCPNCGESLPNPGSGSGLLVPRSRFIVHWCGVCFQYWVLLIGQTTAWDGVQFLRDLREIQEETEEAGITDLHYSIGHSARRALENALRVVSQGALLQRLTTSDRFGNNQVLVSGLKTGLSRTSKPNPDPPSNEERPKLPEGVQVGSVWWHSTNRNSVRILGTQYDGEKLLVEILERGDTSRKGVDLNEFLRVYQRELPRLEVSTGELWKSPDETVLRVLQVDEKKIVLADEQDVHTTVNRRVFQMRYVKVEQKGALDRLLGEDPF